MIAIVISCVALAVSIVSAIYTAMNVSTNRRRLRGEADAARATHFKLKVSGPSVAVFVPGEEPEPSPHWLTASNAGHADAKNVGLTVDAIDTNERWQESADLVPPGEQITIHIGKFRGTKRFSARVEWNDGRRLRKNHSRTLKS